MGEQVEMFGRKVIYCYFWWNHGQNTSEKEILSGSRIAVFSLWMVINGPAKIHLPVYFAL